MIYLVSDTSLDALATSLGGHASLLGGSRPLWLRENTSSLAPRTCHQIWKCSLHQDVHLQIILRRPRDIVGPFFFFNMKSSSMSWVFSRWLYVNFTSLCEFLGQKNYRYSIARDQFNLEIISLWRSSETKLAGILFPSFSLFIMSLFSSMSVCSNLFTSAALQSDL